MQGYSTLQTHAFHFFTHYITSHSLRENTQKHKFWQEKDDLLWLAAERVIIFLVVRISHELVSRDRGEGRATWQSYRGIGSEAYLRGTSQGPTPEDARKDDRIRGRSHAGA